MAKSAGATLTGPAIASARGGSVPLGGKGVIRIGGAEFGKVGFVSSQDARIADTSRSSSLRDFLKSSVKVSRPDQIGFKTSDNSKPGFESVKAVGPINNVPERGKDGGEVVGSLPKVDARSESQRKRGSVAWIGLIKSAIPERGDFVQPSIVKETVRFTEPASSESKTGESAVDLPKTERSTNSYGRIVLQRLENSASLVKVENKADQYAGRLLITLSPVERVNIEFLIRKVRASIVRPRRNQVIPMVDSEVSGFEQAQILPAAASAPFESATDRVTKITNKEVAAPVKNVNRTQNRRRRLDSETLTEKQQSLRKRFVEWDLETNALRLKKLVKNYEEMKAEKPDGEVDGLVLGNKSDLEDRALRSPILDQRGYKNRPDGGLRRMRLLLASIRAVDKVQLKEIINDNTALKETNDKPRQQATRKNMRIVFNPEDKVLVQKDEPLEVIDEAIVTENKQEVATRVVESQGLEPVRMPDQKANPEAANETAELSEFNNVAILSSMFDLKRYDVNQIFNTNFQSLADPFEGNRKELVFN